MTRIKLSGWTAVINKIVSFYSNFLLGVKSVSSGNEKTFSVFITPAGGWRASWFDPNNKTTSWRASHVQSTDHRSNLQTRDDDLRHLQASLFNLTNTVKKHFILKLHTYIRKQREPNFCLFKRFKQTFNHNYRLIISLIIVCLLSDNDLTHDITTQNQKTTSHIQ